MTDLEGIFMTDGVNDAGEPFVTVSAHGTDGTILVGQLSPAEVRQHALGYLEVAEAAEQDAAVLRVIRNLRIDDELAGLVVMELRKSREGE